MRGPRLQPLRIPSGWQISINNLREIDPSPDQMDWFYGAVLIGGSHPGTGRCFDVRFEPEGDPSGQFIADLLQMKFDKNGQPVPGTTELIESRHTRSRDELVATLEAYMQPERDR